MSRTYRLVSDQIGDLPFLELSDPENFEAPLVLILHGLGSRKENMLHALYAFAQAGFRAVGPDLRLHGERPGADARPERLESDYGPTIYEIVAGSIEDLSTLLSHYQAPQAAIHGLSLGGIITFAALLAEPRLVVASVAAGTPDWAGMARASGIGPDHPFYALVAAASPLELAPQSYPPRPLLMLHGALDETVPVDGVVALAERLRPAYRDVPDHLDLVVYPDVAHAYTEDMRQRSVAWTRRFLPPSPSGAVPSGA